MPARPSVLLIAAGRIEGERLRRELIAAGYSPEYVRSVDAGIARQGRRQYAGLVLDWRTLEVEYLGRDWRDAWDRVRPASGKRNATLVLFPNDPPEMPELSQPGVELLGRAGTIGADDLQAALTRLGESAELPEPAPSEPWFGDSEAARQLVEHAQSAARWEGPLVISGPTGAGKKTLAESIHGWSAQRNGPFVVLNCGDPALPALPDDSRASAYLFHLGLLRSAGQEQLLRVLDRGPACRILAGVTGGNGALWERVRLGVFREDLYHRLLVFALYVPGLDERKSDLPPFASRLLEGICRERGIIGRRLLPDCSAALASRAWPGNVRQLRNALMSAVAKAGGRTDLAAADLPEPVAFGPEEPDFKSRVLAFERELIGAALHQTGGNRQQAARLLRIKRTTLIEKLKRFGWVDAED